MTGEDLPHGESTRARAALVEVNAADVPTGPALDALQVAAASGVLAEAMAGVGGARETRKSDAGRRSRHEDQPGGIPEVRPCEKWRGPPRVGRAA